MVSILAVVLALWQPPVQSTQSGDTRAWYQAYQSGVRQVASNPTVAIADLQAAKRSGPSPGRSRSTAGDRTIDFLPDYYLGLAYMNLKRFAEAEAAFKAVGSRLITDKDPEYKTFTEQSTRAAFEVTLALAERELTANRFDLARQAAARAAATYLDTPRVTALNNRIDKEQRLWEDANKPKANDPPRTDPAKPPDPGKPPLTDPGKPPATDPGKAATPPVSTVNNPPQAQQAANRGTGPASNPASKANAPGDKPGYSTPATGGSGSSAAASAVRLAMTSFFSGDYAGAVRQLRAVAAETLPPQGSFYLACSQAALVLSGLADRSTLDAARAEFARAGGADRFAADRRYVSPRILQLLEGGR